MKGFRLINYSIISIKRTVLLRVLFGKNEKVPIKRTVHFKKNLKNEIVYCFYYTLFKFLK